MPQTAAHQAPLSSTISWSLLKFVSIELVMPSNRLILCRPLIFLPSIFPSIRIFPNESALCIRWPKYWSFSYNIRPSDEFQGWFPLELAGLISLLSKGLSRVFSSTTIQKHQFLGTQPSLWAKSHICTWLLDKPSSLNRSTPQTFVGKVMSLFFNTLSRFVIGFLPRRKHLLIPWL